MLLLYNKGNIMLGIFGSTNKFEEILKDKNEYLLSLEKNIDNKNKEIEKLKNELDREKQKNSQLEDEIESLKWKINEVEENSKELNKNNYYKVLYKELKELFGFENESLLISMKDMQEHIAIANERAKQNIEMSNNVEEKFKTAFRDINMIMENLNNLLTKSHNVAKVIVDLSQKAEDIEKFIDQINEVVMQINILSLNASVEAASAGDAGKGFAVVASEVKNLANKTSSVASDIENIVKNIQDSIQNTNTEFKSIDETISNIYDSTSNYDKEIKKVYELTQTSLKALIDLTDNVFMNLAKVDHVIWKINTYKSIYLKKPAFTFVDHHNCRLGKWYLEGEGKKYFSHLPSYIKLEKPHSVIHNSTHKIFNILKNYEENSSFYFQRLKNELTFMEDASKEVFEILNEMLSEAIS